MTPDDTFRKLSQPTYHLVVHYDPNSLCTQAQFDKINSSDLILTTLGEPDFIDAGPVAHYRNITLQELTDEIYVIGQSNIRIEKRTRRVEFIHYSYTQN